ncbi:MAG TPA: Hsp33 family molecular chaperone HslO, partial [Bacteroidia bacterium]|nr:Hsp33 family molecular chaperone HslO [Bacteroidia bacterium]
SNRIGNIVGRLFTEDIRQRDQNLLISQTTVSGQEPRQSLIEAETLDFFAIGEAFYLQSEQRVARYFHCGGDEFALLTSQPDCDLEWLAALDDEVIREIDRTETLGLLETRQYRFDCGCGPERIYPIVANLTEDALASVFAGSETMSASCPRCGARYMITREALEACRRDHAR